MGISVRRERGGMLKGKRKYTRTMITKEQETLLKEYLVYAKIKGHREQGLIGLRVRIPKLFEFLNEKGISLHELGVKQAQEFQGWLLETGKQDGRKYSKNSILAYLTAASALCECMKQKGILKSNPFKEIRKIRRDKKIPRNLLKEKEMNQLLSELGRFGGGNLKNRIINYRVHVIAELMYATGLRISEVAALTPGDIDLQRGTVSVCDGKSGKSRIVFLNEYAREVLRIYIEKMRDLVFSEWNERNAGLLFGVQWAWLSRPVNRVLNNTAKKLGHEGFTSHGFRHCFGYHLLRAGCNIRYIQQLLGHAHLKNTEIYTKVDKEDLKQVLDTYHPRKWKRTENEKTDS